MTDPIYLIYMINLDLRRSLKIQYMYNQNETQKDFHLVS